MVGIDWTKIHDKTDFSIATPPLAFFSFLYGLGLRVRFLVNGLIKKRTLPGFVVSIGNLTVGGTGKTPAACMLAEWASGQGCRVAILSRGYGGHYRSRVLEVSDGKNVYATPAEGGDEPYLLAKKLPGVSVVISKKRYLAGLTARRKFKANFFILDDGFQHVALRRDLDLVLIDASNPFGNGRLLPWGPLRERERGLKRADVFLLTRVGKSPPCGELRAGLNSRFPGKPLFLSDHTPERVIFPVGNRAYPPEFLKGRRIIAFAGIAKPKVFKETLLELGAEIALFRSFKDHHQFQQSEIEDLILQRKNLNGDFLLTTEKDWVRIEGLSRPDPDLAYLSVKFTLLKGEEAFFQLVKDRIEGSGKLEGVRGQGESLQI